MELYQLRTFAAVAELGNLTQAAERLHVSQPAASAQIKMLEEEFGVRLFERKRSGLNLTPAGKLLRPKIQHLLETAGESLMRPPSRNFIIAGIPFLPGLRATSIYFAPLSSSARRTNSPRPWMVGQ